MRFEESVMVSDFMYFRKECANFRVFFFFDKEYHDGRQ